MGDEIQFPRHLGQGLLVHQAGPQAAEVALLQSRMAAVEGLGHAGVDERIAQEFQAFIVVAADATVGERELQQARVRETVSERPLQRGAVSGQCWPAV